MPSAKRTITIFLFTFVVLEATARWGLGLGTPPLSVQHPTIEYMFAPNQDVHRFGNRQIYNAQGMRSEPLVNVGDRHLSLVFGDSVINGGNLTDHSELATTLATDNNAFFGNVSAGSWGPGNYRAWIDEFGLLGAQTAIFVLSNHDLNDQPTFAPLDPTTHPTETPLFALGEGVSRYLPRYLPSWLAHAFKENSPAVSDAAPDGQPTGLEDLETIFALLNSEGVSACIIHHPTQAELAGAPRNGKAKFEALATAWGIPNIDMMASYLEQIDASQLYREHDDIHVNEKGQQALSEALSRCAASAIVPSK